MQYHEGQFSPAHYASMSFITCAPLKFGGTPFGDDPDAHSLGALVREKIFRSMRALNEVMS